MEEPHEGGNCDIENKVKALQQLNNLVDESGNKIVARACPHCGSIW